MPSDCCISVGHRVHTNISLRERHTAQVPGYSRENTDSTFPPHMPNTAHPQGQNSGISRLQMISPNPTQCHLQLQLMNHSPSSPMFPPTSSSPLIRQCSAPSFLPVDDFLSISALYPSSSISVWVT